MNKTATAEGRRANSHQRGYTRKWYEAAKLYRSLHPHCECEECAQLGRVLPSEVVDHKIPHRGNRTLFWDVNNWQAMAKVCHDKKTARGE